ncbi:hypothetical protein ACIBO2_26240 [Nonomuraea sp. NPDC050022]|uniref:hypothetical protein n=1 Tax=Nonomuraea sp. NPDC050022 TaxID=3364358 RepID=UPI003797C74D
MTMTTQRYSWMPETPTEQAIREGLVIPRTPQCVPWCVRHCVLDDGLSTFCMGPDMRTPLTSNGYVGIVFEPEPQGSDVCVPMIDLGNGLDTVKVEAAEEFARAILAQVARARGQEEAK